jgi:hypothetical protein
MKVAFLFEKKYPAYDHAFRVIQTVPVDERDELDTLISMGFWELNTCVSGLGLRQMDEIVPFAARLIHNQEGSMTRVVSDESIVEMVRGDVFAVIVHSIRRSLAVRLHELLKSTDEYRGFIQILPHLAIHRQIFGFCPPALRLERKSLFIWSPEDSDSAVESYDEPAMADEMCEWAREQYPLMGLEVRKKSVGFKGTMVDKDSDSPFTVQLGSDSFVEKWSEIAEHVIFKLDDFAPDVVAELTAALKGLGKPKLTEADCGQVAASLRRSLELLAEVLSTGNPESLTEARLNRRPQGDRYKNLIWNYLVKHFSHNQFLKEEICFEVEHVGRLLDKGVHEHWIMETIQPLAIRTLLVINSLLFPVKSGVVQCRVGDDLFN